MSRRDHPRHAGWYRDPNDPTVLRHWTGKGWDSRRRNLPAWSIGTSDLETLPPREPGADEPVYDGPVRPAALPAAATSSAAKTARRHLVPVAGRSGRRDGRPPAGTGFPLGAVTSSAAFWSRPRSSLMVTFALLGVVVLALASAVAGSKGRPAAPAALTQDIVFLREANAACSATMGAVRVGSTPTISAEGTPAGPSLTAVATANARLQDLEQRLIGLNDDPLVRTDIQSWIDDWSAYAAARQRSATYLAAHPHLSGATARQASSLAASEDHSATLADAFALTNGLGDCTLSEHPGPAVVQFP